MWTRNARYSVMLGFSRGLSLPAAQRLASYASPVNPASCPGTAQAWTRRLLRCGVAAGPVFVAVFLLEGAVRDGYRPLRHPVSSLALGPRGWIQAGNFAAAGTLFLAAAAGLARTGDLAAGRAAPALIGAARGGADRLGGLPHGPDQRLPAGNARCTHPPHPYRRGTQPGGSPGIRGLPAAALATSWRSWRAGQHRFGLYSAGTAVTMLTTMALAGAGLGQSPRLINFGGMFQRASIITGFAWLTALCAQALRRTPSAAAPRHQTG